MDELIETHIAEAIDGDESGRHWRIVYNIRKSELEETGIEMYEVWEEDGQGNGVPLGMFYKQRNANVFVEELIRKYA